MSTEANHKGKIFIVDIPELPGCMAHGATKFEAIAMTEDAAAFWIKIAKEDGADSILEVQQ